MLLFYSTGENRRCPLSFLLYFSERNPSQTNLSKKEKLPAQAMEKCRGGSTQSEAGAQMVSSGIYLSLSCLHFILMASILTQALLEGRQNSKSCKQTNLKPSRKRAPVSQCARYQELHLIILDCIMCPSLNILAWFWLVSLCHVTTPGIEI